MPTVFVISGDNTRILRSTDFDNGLLYWEMSQPLPEPAIIQELVAVHGHCHILRVLLPNGDHAVFYSPDDCMSFEKVFDTSSEILDITALDNNWVVMFLGNGHIYESTTSGSSFDEMCSNGPLIKSVTSYKVTYDTETETEFILGHDGRYIWRSVDNMVTWEKVCDLSTFSGWFDGCTAGIKYGGGRAFALAGGNVVFNTDLEGLVWSKLAANYILDYDRISRLRPNFRQIVHVGFDSNQSSIDADWKKAQWMLSVDLRSTNITRNYMNDPTLEDGVFRPVADLELDASNRLNAFNNVILGQDGKDKLMHIGGRRTQTDGDLHEVSQHITTTDGQIFSESHTIKLATYNGEPVGGRIAP